MDYSSFTVAGLKVMINARLTLRGVTDKVYTTKTRRDALIAWLVGDDAVTEALEASRLTRNAQDQERQRRAFRSAPVVRKSNIERIADYMLQNGHETLTVRQERQIRRMRRRAMQGSV